MPLGAPMDYSFVAGDTASVLVVYCRRSDDDSIPVDLTGASVKLMWRIDGGTLVTRGMTIADASAGKATYEFTTSELAAGIMSAEVEVTTADGITTSLESFRFTIRARV